MYYCRLLLSLGFLFIVFNGFSQDLKELPPGYYVVVSAYAPSQEKMAQQYVNALKHDGHDAAYGFNSTRKFYFVYLKYFDSLGESLREMEDTRGQGTFTDAWVRVVSGGLSTPSAVSADSSLPPGVRATSSVPIKSTPTVEVPESPQPNNEALAGNPEIPAVHASTHHNGVLLNIFNARNNHPVGGDVSVIDSERSRLITKAEGNKILDLPDPKSTSRQITLICDVFGYRKLQQEISYPLTFADTIEDFIEVRDSTLVINFDLVRYHKGDIATLYNVYFYNDASIMLPESKYELNSLLQLLQENPRYRIRLHGHTNGNYHGKMFTLGPEKNFFSLTGSVQGIGTARQLSYNRAEIVKDYMASLGIDPNRMELKGWGGRRPIYDKNSANAKRNVRVAVEILED